MSKEREEVLETDAAIAAFEDFYSIGYNRNIETLVSLYKETPLDEPVPTRSIDTLKMWKNKFNWEGRCAERERRDCDIINEIDAPRRLKLKNERMNAVRRMRSLCEKILIIIEKKLPDIQNMAVEDLVKFMGMVMKGLQMAIEEERKELGEETSRSYITIDMVLDKLPIKPEVKLQVRESLIKQLERPNSY